MEFQYKTKGTCSQKIIFKLDGGRIYNVEFVGGCHGNTQGIARLAEGRDAKELVEILRGIRCGFKDTSCPDQLARAIKKALEQ